MPRTGLDRRAVVEAAAELADSGGLESVTLAALAHRLGVRTPSLYNHVSGLDGLRRELALLGLRELGTRLGRVAVGKAGGSAVEAIAAEYRSFVRERPGLYSATLRSPRRDNPPDGELLAAEEELLEVVLAVLEGYGLEGDDLVHAARGLRSLVHGFSTLEAAGGFGLDLDPDESFRRMLRSFTAGLTGDL